MNARLDSTSLADVLMRYGQCLLAPGNICIRCFLPPRCKDVDPKKKHTNMRYPQVLCIISPFPWFPFYFKVDL